MAKKDNKNDLSTQNRLLRVATKQFALYGYEKTTTRSIVLEANANLSSISFHYENKEKLYQAVLENIVDICTTVQGKVFNEIDAVEKQGLLSPEMAWTYIATLVDVVVDMNFNEDFYYDSLVIKRESLFPSPAFISVAPKLSMIYGYLEKLYLIYTGSDDRFWAANGAYFTMSTVFAYSNFPKLMEKVLKKNVSDVGVASAVKAGLKNNILVAVKAVLQNQKESLAR